MSNLNISSAANLCIIYVIGNDPVLQYHLKQRADHFEVLGREWRQQITGLLSMGIEPDWPDDAPPAADEDAVPANPDNSEGPGDDEASEYDSDKEDIVLDGDEVKDEDDEEEEDADEDDETVVGSVLYIV